MAMKGDTDKKKTVILGALVVVICGVGAFQFMSGSSEPAPAAKKEKAEAPADGTIKKDIDAAKNVAQKGDETTAQTNSAMPGSTNTAPGGGSDITAAVASTASSSKNDPLRELYKDMKLPTRDPFEDTTNPKQVEQQQPPVKPPTQVANNTPKRRMKPDGLQGTLPFNPMPGVGGGDVNIGPNMQISDGFGYRVTGMIDGARPAVVFSDDQGNQRLVPVGATLDGDSKVVSASKGKVVVSHKGKNITLTMGGQPNAK